MFTGEDGRNPICDLKLHAFLGGSQVHGAVDDPAARQYSNTAGLFGDLLDRTIKSDTSTLRTAQWSLGSRQMLPLLASQSVFSHADNKDETGDSAISLKRLLLFKSSS